MGSSLPQCHILSAWRRAFHIAAWFVVSHLCVVSVASAWTLPDVIDASREARCADLGPAEVEGDAVARTLALIRLTECQLSEGAFGPARDAWQAARSSASFEAVLGTAELSRLPELEARMLLLEGNASVAAERFDALRSRSRSSRVSLGEQARLTYYLGLAREASGDTEGAGRAYEQLIREFPASQYVSRVAPRFVGLTLDAGQQREMAAAALAGRHYAASEELLFASACNGGRRCSPREAATSGERERYEAAYDLGFMLYRYRREFVERSLPWLETIAALNGSRRADAAYYYAAAVQRMERNMEARRAWLAFIEAFPGDGRTDEARYQAAFLLVEDDRHAEAVPELQAYLDGGGENLSSARRWLAWSLFMLERYEESIAFWSLVGNREGPWWRGQSMYWSAVCHDRLGERERAETLWNEVITSYPLTYYAVLSARRLGHESLVGFPTDLRVGALDEPMLRDAHALAAAIADRGAFEEARVLAELVPSVRRAPPWGIEIAQPLWEARLESDPADWRGWRTEFAALESRAPTSESEVLRARLVFPRFFDGIVHEFAAERELPASVIWGVMRQESVYDPYAISVSDAMGLMQVIPQTAQAIAARMGERYVDGMLFEPYHAVRYGTWYLEQLRIKFNEQMPLAIGAYNAGPLAMESWVDRNAGRPFDEFVEEIAYDQARDYIKKVLTHAVGYELGEADPEVLLSPTLGGLFPETIEGGYGDNVQF